MTELQGPRPPKLPEDAADPLPTLANQIVELSTITGGLAHEIRNSLSTLRMNLQLLDEDWRRAESSTLSASLDNPEMVRRGRGRIGTLLSESRRLESILDDFLLFVSKRELHLKPTDVNKLLVELADFYQPQAEAHHVTLDIHIADDALPCELDINLFKQAILNLMINAQQAMDDGGRLTIQTSVVNDETARIDIMDTGPGIPEEQQKNIFQAYFSTKKSGTGLGLAMTRQIVREHGGRIHVHSEPSCGTCFTILLQRTHIKTEPTR